MKFLYLSAKCLFASVTVAVAALLCLATVSMLSGCKTIETGSLHARTSRMLAEVDSIQSATRSISIMEIDKRGEVTVYQRIRFQNPSDKPLESLPGIGSFAAIPLFSVGGEQATVEFGPYLPNQIERHYTATLQHPVPPGAWVDIMMVGERMAKYKATEVEDGLWRFGPVTAEMDFSKMACLFAVKFPPGARMVTAQPKPDEIRHDDAHTIIWNKAFTGTFQLSVEYRLDGTKPQ